MNKKQRNRKIVKQNNRNRMINRRYISTIKTLSKLLIKNIKNLSLTSDSSAFLIEKSTIEKILNNLYSILDKAVKKGVVHKNTAARKKARVMKFFKSNIKTFTN